VDTGVLYASCIAQNDLPRADKVVSLGALIRGEHLALINSLIIGSSLAFYLKSIYEAIGLNQDYYWTSDEIYLYVNDKNATLNCPIFRKRQTPEFLDVQVELKRTIQPTSCVFLYSFGLFS
jgi:hypothetical protein